MYDWLLTKDKILATFRAIGEQASSPGRVLVCGGTSAVLEGWRDGTVDIDLSYAVEPGQFFEALARVKAEQDVSVDLLSPASFVPLLPGAADRHEQICRFGQVDFLHFDFYTQALAKLQRGRARDTQDVAAMVATGKVEPRRLDSLFQDVRQELIRYPAIDPDDLTARLARFLESQA